MNFLGDYPIAPKECNPAAAKDAMKIVDLHLGA